MYLADFHIHSHYSLATSRDLTPERLDWWARAKGIEVLGTGDFTHPGWTRELREKLEPAEPGLWRLRDAWRLSHSGLLGDAPEVRFLLTAEVSTIRKRGPRTRKVHHLLFAPDFECVERLQKDLTDWGGNLTSDGRPVLGMDPRELLERVLSVSPDMLLVPAHVWTPWFSALGSKSGFDSIEECYGDLADRVPAVETGLSADPPMLWACSRLDRFALLSNSDAHSPEKVGRNATLLETERSYDAIVGAIRSGDPKRLVGTVDLFPEEGKYHLDGHRKCAVAFDPVETRAHGGLCPVCGKEVTVGVLNRVAQLADRADPLDRPRRGQAHSVVPLKEILSEMVGTGASSQKVDRRYWELLKKLGPELPLLLWTPEGHLAETGEATLAEAIRRVRARTVEVTGGYDGEFGRVRVFSDEERTELNPKKRKGEMTTPLFTSSPSPFPPRGLLGFDVAGFQRR
jgi:uncharacterized protein (TIGR00375 family)